MKTIKTTSGGPNSVLSECTDCEIIPPGKYNAMEFAKRFPNTYRQLRLAGYRGVDVGTDVSFEVRKCDELFRK